MNNLHESRYFYYIVFINMIVAMFLMIPYFLSQHLFDGALSSSIVALFIGIGLLYLFTRVIKVFPGTDLTSVIKQYLNKVSYIITLLFLGLLTSLGSIVFLLTLSQIITLYINPELTLVIVITILAGFVSLASGLRSSSLLYSLEIVLFLTFPLLLFILSKGFLNAGVDWYAILEIGTHLNKKPILSVVSITTFIFSGYLTMIVFNNFFTKTLQLKYFWFVGILGFVAIITSIFIPIGFHGTIDISNYFFPWISASDVLYFEFFIVERMIFIFIAFLTILTLMNAILYGHVGFYLLKKVIPFPTKPSKFFGLFCLVFLLIGILAAFHLNHHQVINITMVWLNLRLIGEVLFIIILFYIAKRRNLHEPQNNP